MIVVLMYCDADAGRALALARLLAEIESGFRDGVVLLGACQPGTARTADHSATLRACEKKFTTVFLDSPRGGVGHPEGCGQLWAGTMELCGSFWPGEPVFTVDGGDGVPLHRNWLDLVLAEHSRTVAAGLMISGTPYDRGGCPVHVNPNAVFAAEVLEAEPSLLRIPKCDGTVLTHFDVYHRRAMLRRANLSSLVWTDWRGGGVPATLDLMADRARKSAWLHGYKDECLYDLAREHLGRGLPPPVLERYDARELVLRESLGRRRSA